MIKNIFSDKRLKVLFCRFVWNLGIYDIMFNVYNECSKVVEYSFIILKLMVFLYVNNE